MKCLRETCVSVLEFDLEELIKLEDRLRLLGFNIFEDVEGHFDHYRDGYYGIDITGDVLFYSHPGGFDCLEEDVSSRDEFLKLSGLELPNPYQLQPVTEPSNITLYKVTVESGDRIFYFDSRQALTEVLKADNIGDARRDLAVIVMTTSGAVLKNVFTPLKLIETNFTIEEI